jgi:prolyl-tRNA synthetase
MQEAVEETMRMVQVYSDFAENFMAMPVIIGRKSENERFAGALDTYCIEALMQDGKALQAGTSHFLGQNFAKAFDVQFTSNEGKLEYVWATSWGVSTRLMGALVMAHSDDNGLVLPPKLAPIQVVIVPIYKGSDQLSELNAVAEKIKKDLEVKGISVKYDNRDTHKPGWKFAEYELKGVPVRLALGPRDLENGTIEIARRDTLEKKILPQENIASYIADLLDEIQKSIYAKALKFREENIRSVSNWNEFQDVLDNKGGFISAFWDGTAETEVKIKEETKATIRCIPLDSEENTGTDIYSGKPGKFKVLYARAY